MSLSIDGSDLQAPAEERHKGEPQGGDIPLRSLLKNVLLEKVTLQRHFLENLTFVMSNDRVSRICLWNRETDVATTYSQESVVTTTLSSMTHFLGAISASLLEINSHL